MQAIQRTVPPSESKGLKWARREQPWGGTREGRGGRGTLLTAGGKGGAEQLVSLDHKNFVHPSIMRLLLLTLAGQCSVACRSAVMLASHSRNSAQSAVWLLCRALPI